MTTNVWALHKAFSLAAVALAAMACFGAGQAAEKLRYEEIPNRIAPFGSVLEHRGFKVITLDGTEHRGRQLRLDADHLRIFRGGDYWEDLPSDQIQRIEIRQAGRFSHRILESAVIPLVGALCFMDRPVKSVRSWVGCFIPVTAMLSPALAYAAVSAPIYLAFDGVAFLVPPKVYEIVR